MPTKKITPPSKKKLPKPPPRKPKKRGGVPEQQIALTATKEAVETQLKSAFNVLMAQSQKGENADEEKLRSASALIKSWCRNSIQIAHAAATIEHAEIEIQQLEMDIDYEGDSDEDRDAEYQIQSLEEDIAYAEDDYWEAVSEAVDDLKHRGIWVDIPKFRRHEFE